MARRDFQQQIDQLERAVNGLRSALDSKIDAVRSELTDLILRGFADLRQEHRQQRNELSEATRGGLAELRVLLNEMNGLLARERTDASEVLREIAVLRQEAAEARADALTAGHQKAGAGGTPPPGQEPAATSGPGDHDDLLELAAGVAYAEIACHRDTWAFLVEQTARDEHFRLPGDVREKPDGTLEADLSGRSLIAVIGALWRTRTAPATPAGTRALAAEVYQRVSEALQEMSPATDDPPGPVTRIVIDNRPRGGAAGRPAGQDGGAATEPADSGE